jgi:Ca2+-binding EF-hand superfamily protein
MHRTAFRAGLLAALIGVAAAPVVAATPAKGTPTAGGLTRAQMQARVKQVFDRADTNHDGFMNLAEFRARMGAVLNRTPPGTAGAPSKQEAQDMLDAATAAFKEVDTNNDGKLSLAESMRRPMSTFDLIDANHDGVLTAAEQSAADRKGAEGR